MILSYGFRSVIVSESMVLAWYNNDHENGPDFLTVVSVQYGNTGHTYMFLRYLRGGLEVCTRMKKHVSIASDHAGFTLKEALIDFLKDEGYEVDDMGPTLLNPTDDYPDYILPLAKKVALRKDSFGIIIGGSGQGEAIAANHIHGIRAVVYYGGSLDIIRLSREHNDANILSLGARFLSVDEAWDAVRLWLTTSFSHAERHVRRIEKLP